MKRIILKTTFFGIFLLISRIVSAQFIDNYGLRIGVGISNQYWEYKYDMFSNLSGWKENRLGPIIYLNAEKKIIKYLSIRTEFGYNQKGFKDEIYYINSTLEDNVILHNLSLNIGGKFTPIDTKLKPYIILGLRVDYLLDYKDFEVDENGEKYRIYHSILDDYKRFVLSGLIGIGLVYHELVYLDIEFNPAITKNLDDSGMSIKDKYFGFTIGLNINNLISRSE